MDPRLRDLNGKKDKKNAWFKDQYKHPHESKHTIGEVLKWFDKSGFEFIKGIPPVNFSEKFEPEKPLFEKGPKVTLLDRFLVQSNMILHGSHEGGLFIMIGKRI